MKNNFKNINALLTVLAVVLLAGCGDGREVRNPMDVYSKQSLAWGACENTSDVFYEPIADRMQCAVMQAPMDYDHPADGSIEIAIMQVKAISSNKKTEPLFFNPGGPGANGYLFGALFALALSEKNGTDPTSPYYQVQQNFDLVGFGPRGVGQSTALECPSSDMLEPVDNSVSGRTAENIAAQLRNTKTIALACEKNPLTKHIHTDATAKDLELMRQVFGASKLNFYGASYGTWLGMWYAGLYPERVGKMILDSSVDFTSALQDTALLQGPALTRAFNEVLAPYAARHSSVFELGNDVEAIRNVMAQLHPTVRAATARKIYGSLFQSSLAPKVFDYLVVAKRLSAPPFQALWPQGRVEGDFSALKSLILQEDFSPQKEKISQLRNYANAIVAEVEGQRKKRAVSDDEIDPVYTAVVCNDDFSKNSSQEWWAEQETLMLTQFPILGTADIRSCQYWQRPVHIVKPSMTAMKNLDMLMLQSEFDGATPAEGALVSFSNLPKSHMVLVRGGMDHGVALSNACGKNHFAHYLLGTSPGQRTSECAAEPFAEDTAQGQH